MTFGHNNFVAYKSFDINNNSIIMTYTFINDPLLTFPKRFLTKIVIPYDK